MKLEFPYFQSTQVQEREQLVEKRVIRETSQVGPSSETKGPLGNPKLFFITWLFSFVAIYLGSLLFRQPGYMDAYYYYDIARNLAEGRGFVEDFIWNYLYLPPEVIHPSNLHWMPLTSIVVAPFLAYLGESFRSAQLPMIFIASFLPPVTFAIGMRIFGNARQSLIAAVLALFSGYYFIHWSAIDAFGIFGLSVTFTLLSLHGLSQTIHASWQKQALLAIAAGVFTAISHLSRADGILLLPVSGLALVLDHLFFSSGGKSTFWQRIRVKRTATLFSIIVTAYLATMLPWFIHNLQVIGSPLPLGSSQSIFLREYNEFYSYERELTLKTYLEWGIGPILGSKFDVMGKDLLILLGMEHYLLPFIAIGLWSLRRNSWYLPFSVYAVSLFLFMTFIFTFPASRGSMLHSSVALIPWFTLAASRGIEVVIEAVARRRSHWNLTKAKRNLGIIFVSFSVFFSTVVIIQNAVERDKEFNSYSQLASWFRQHDPSALIMLSDPPCYYYVSSQSSLVVPDEPAEVVVRAARRYGATYVILEDAHSRYLDGLYEGKEESPLLTRVGEIGDLRIFKVQDEG